MALVSANPSSSHPDLHTVHARLKHIHTALASYQPIHAEPPVIDSTTDQESTNQGQSTTKEGVPGLRFLREEVKRDLDVLTKFLAGEDARHQPPLSTNAPYLIAVWNELLTARPVVQSVYKNFFPSDPHQDDKNNKSSRAERRKQRGTWTGVKVDIVADSGKEWIRVNTIKNARILVEFREQDSYLTSSESESDDEPRNSVHRANGLRPPALDNSVLKMARALLAAAQDNPVPGTGGTPRVTLRLTRLSPEPAPGSGEATDPRIGKTIETLQEMGINVLLGEGSGPDDSSLAPHSEPVASSMTREVTPRPTRCINLDLSFVIALISDITHSPVPSTEEEAQERYVPSQRYRDWKIKRLQQLSTTSDPTHSTDSLVNDESSQQRWNGDDTTIHSRALAAQAVQEIYRGLLQDVQERLSSIYPGLDSVEFWMTWEARRRCLQIVGKIGGLRERLRAAALFPPSSNVGDEGDTGVPVDDELMKQYWATSRYAQGLLPILPIRFFPSALPPEVNSADDSAQTPPPFFRALENTCRTLLAPDEVLALGSTDPPLPSASSPPYSEDAAPPAVNTDNAQEEPGEIPAAAVLRSCPRLTVHTVQSLLWGAARGWTTLTTNRSSVRTVLREVRRATGDSWFSYHSEPPARGPLDGSTSAADAAIWIADPRSLAEGMRSDAGDFNGEVDVEA
ncbi:hypothetical protein CONPUDRAFT_125876 [Coniophora puteana RWD-64-598 SS2]|uniref:DUF1308 domain-containing protein n=1 Tax=Coniophora puteana (strain RWD-64-598) TaxID=741705 RepID=A0A5M3MJZ2_CONPW|nr:uncharacterized protein CONPUDRAFT_125876 [Coniophora puteana RWD-64-598 SS2]EIW79548.1 hypothetical protein CONPUDRAFT_125876 [Coniophora puteana RWD-64-598 SS2]